MGGYNTWQNSLPYCQYFQQVSSNCYTAKYPFILFLLMVKHSGKWLMDVRKNPDPPQKLIDLSLAHGILPWKYHQNPLTTVLIEIFCRYIRHRQTDRPTHRPLRKYNHFGGRKNTKSEVHHQQVSTWLRHWGCCWLNQSFSGRSRRWGRICCWRCRWWW